VGFPHRHAGPAHRRLAAYHIAVQIQAGQIDHTPAPARQSIPQGRERTIYLTQMNYASISARRRRFLAGEAASLLPATPRGQPALAGAHPPAWDVRRR